LNVKRTYHLIDSLDSGLRAKGMFAGKKELKIFCGVARRLKFTARVN
jgi:hypothetical protein